MKSLPFPAFRIVRTPGIVRVSRVRVVEIDHANARAAFEYHGGREWAPFSSLHSTAAAATAALAAVLESETSFAFTSPGLGSPAAPATVAAAGS